MKQKGFAPIVILIILALTIVGYFGYKNYWTKILAMISPQNYEECEKTPGSFLLNVFPGVCVTRSGKRFTQSLTSEQGTSPCYPSYTHEDNTPELTARQWYSTKCFSSISKDDCLSVDIYNKGTDDFTKPDGIPDCLWSDKNNISQICGGFAGMDCPYGYSCKLDGNYPDASGICIKESDNKTDFKCPVGGWVDCMPGTTAKPECSTEAMEWYKTNCPDFKGGAY